MRYRDEIGNNSRMKFGLPARLDDATDIMKNCHGCLVAVVQMKRPQNCLDHVGRIVD
jgi:hypothetical protein